MTASLPIPFRVAGDASNEDERFGGYWVDVPAYMLKDPENAGHAASYALGTAVAQASVALGREVEVWELEFYPDSLLWRLGRA